MPDRLLKSPPSMTVADFLAWPGDGTGRRFQLVDGEVRAMSPGGTTHGRIQSRLANLIDSSLSARASPCDVLTEPGVATRVRANINVRVPDLGVTCAPDSVGEQLLPDPVLLIEILSPTNVADTWEKCLVLLHHSECARDCGRPFDARAGRALATGTGWPLAGRDGEDRSRGHAHIRENRIQLFRARSLCPDPSWTWSQRLSH
jgi:Putative restriction endonuclease